VLFQPLFDGVCGAVFGMVIDSTRHACPSVRAGGWQGIL
jgi:hypothetical protein